jgi:hypothetical protein
MVFPARAGDRFIEPVIADGFFPGPVWRQRATGQRGLDS